MRRRSERKKSTDVSSPAPAAASRRISRRSRKSPSVTGAEDAAVVETPEADSAGGCGSEESSAEMNIARKSRSTRNRTPVTERGSPAKTSVGGVRKIQHAAIPEEENGATTSELTAIADGETERKEERVENKEAEEVVKIEQDTEDSHASDKSTYAAAADDGQEEEEEETQTPIELSAVVLQDEKLSKSSSDVLELEIQTDEQEDNENEKAAASDSDGGETNKSMPAEQRKVEPQEEKNENSFDSAAGLLLKNIEREAQPIKKNIFAASHVGNRDGDDDAEEMEHKATTVQKDDQAAVAATTHQAEPEKKSSSLTLLVSSDVVTAAARTQRKRRWLSKKATDACKTAPPIISISTDSLKNLIADVHPVPLSDVQLDSSSEVEEVVSEREEGEETPSPERIPPRHTSMERKVEASSSKRRNSSNNNQMETISITTSGAVGGHGGAATAKAPPGVQRSPSPARNQASQVLYITNLVRPFTVLQLKGLLARTGKICDNGFWIDRIKSKCYVQYETDDQAIETRHALHGVRWPVSNPKCLNVDFGVKANMERAIASTKEDGPKFGQDNHKDNVIVGGTGWNRDRHEVDDKKGARPVREWDVGKKESLDRDKKKDQEKHRSRERERDNSGNRENEKNIRDRKDRRGREPRSRSLSPVRKIKKNENDPPLRLLDDLFRKTKATPCIYWLPLTPEQIAEKEAFRQKRIEEHKQRIKQRELERGKEREKDRDRRGSSRDKRRY